MTDSVEVEVERFMADLRAKNPHQPEFQQAVHEVCESVMPLVLDDKRFRERKILERMTEPDRIITFRVCWEDDNNNVHDEPRVARAVQQRDRSLQRRHALPPDRQPRRS